MREKLQEYALIAEIIGGLAIVISLLVVSYQISLSTDATKAATEQALMAELNNWRMTVGADPEKHYAFLHPENAIDELTEIQLMQRTINLDAFWGIQESAYLAHEDEYLSEKSWNRFYRVMCGIYLGYWPDAYTWEEVFL